VIWLVLFSSLSILLTAAPQASGQAFPSTVVLDNFNRASLGAAWSTTAGCTNGMTISGSIVAISAAADYGCATYETTTYGTNVEVFATMTMVPNVGLDAGLSVRGGAYGFALIRNSGTNDDVAQIGKPGTPAIGGDCPLGMDLAAGQVWGLRSVYSSPNTTLTLYVDGVLKCTRSDSTPTGGGKLQMYVSNPPNAWDNFGGGDMPVTATTCRMALMGVC
jgi:hypothetical protein